MEFIDEIRQQPGALRDFMDLYFKRAKVEELIKYIESQEYEHVIFSGMGSSYFAAMTGAQFLRKCGFTAHAFESGELARNDNEVLANGKKLLVLVSQTGKSSEVLELARLVKKSIPTVVISNHSERELAEYADYFIDIRAGEENFTSSKTYTNTLAALLMVCYAIAGLNSNSLNDILNIVCKKMEELLSGTRNLNRACEVLKGINNLFFIGSGYSYFTATHAELVSGEVAKIFGSRYTVGQFLHGPVEMMSAGIGYFLFDSNYCTRDKAEKIIDMALQSGGTVIHFSDRVYATDLCNYVNIPLPFIREEVMPLIEIIPFELLINSIAEARGYKPGVLNFVEK